MVAGRLTVAGKRAAGEGGREEEGEKTHVTLGARGVCAHVGQQMALHIYQNSTANSYFCSV